MKYYRAFAVLLVLVLGGCSRGVETKAAIRQALVEHLAQRPGLSVSAMQIEVTAVNFRKNEADATVSFRPKGGGEGMQMTYTLERQGNRWMVKGRPGSGSGAHGGMSNMPAGPPPTGTSGMPAGHSPMEKGAAPGSKK